MRSSADIVIIGGGIVGASIPYQLTAASSKSVLILERETHQGKGSSGKADLILTRAPSLVDATLLDYARFAEDRLGEETAVL